MTKTALITGATGQDGALLARLLLAKGYTVWGTTRDVQTSNLSRLKHLGIHDKIKMLSMVPEDFRSVFLGFTKAAPDEIYHLAGQSSVGLSFELPAETMESFTLSSLNVLEALRVLNLKARVYFAGSSECFGDTAGAPANERTPFHPKSPYAVAKSAAFWLVDNYRDAYGIWAATGILFNHESSLRPAHFVTQKIIRAAARIAGGSTEKLTLGRLDISRDWGWAEEYVEAMWLMLQQETPQDFVIATGVTSSLEDFVNAAFALKGLEWKKHVVQDKALFRPTDISISKSDPSLAAKRLGWKATTKMPELVSKLINESA